MSLRKKEERTVLLSDKLAAQTKRTSHLLLVIMMMLQLIFPIVLSVSASSEDDADEPTTVEVQAQEDNSDADIESPKSSSVSEEPAEEVEEIEEPETPPAPAPEEKEELGENVVDEPVNKPEENTKEQPNAPPKAPETPEAPETKPEPVPEPEEVKEEVEEVTTSELQASEDIGIMQITNHVYDPDNDFEVIELSGAVSQNSHTQAKWIWIQDGYLYMAVASTHGIQTLTVNGVSAQASANGEFVDGAHSVVVHTVHDTITIEGFGGAHSPVTYTSGNTNDARWSIVRFYNPYELLNLQATGNTIASTSIAGGGHNIGTNTKFDVNIPTKSATLNKVWYLGPGGPVEVNLFTSIDGGTTWSEDPYDMVTLTPEDQGDGTFTATYNWSELPFTDALGRRLVYKAEEANPGENYEPEMTTHYNPNTNHYTFTLINTYQVPEQDLIVTKNWIGGPESDHVPIDITLWRTTDGITIDEVIGVDPVIAPDTNEYSTAPSFTYTWENLPEETDAGVPYTYYYTEEGLDSNRYDRTYDNSTTIGGVLYGTFTSFKGTVTNKYKIPKTEVEATKEWVGGEKVRPDLWFQLRRVSTVDGETVDEAVEVKELPKTGNTVTINFSELDETDFNGNKYTFYVVEGTYDGSTFTEAVPENFVKTENAEKLVLTNTYEIPTQDIQTVKYWENGEKVRPDLWYQLRRKLIINNEVLSDVPVGIQQVPADGDTVDILFEDVDQTDFNGSKYTFYVVEGVYDGETFTAIEEDTIYEDFLVERVNELAFKNSYQITETTATATKRWMGSNPSDFEEVEYTLWRTQKTGDFTPADFEVVEVIPTVTQSTEDPSVYYYSWSVESTDSTGNAYYYYFAEDEVPPGFQRIYSDDAIDVDGTQYEPSGGTIINKQLTIDFNFTKVDESGEPLQGAEFTLESEDGEDSIANTGTDPEFIFAGLTEGRYILRETKAPAGYSLPTTTWIIEVIRNEAGALEIVIPDDSFLNATEEGNQLVNKQQGEFPQTGGIGVASYIGVGMLAIMSSIGFYIKKEKNGGYQDE